MIAEEYAITNDMDLDMVINEADGMNDAEFKEL